MIFIAKRTSNSLDQLKDLRACDGLGTCFLRSSAGAAGGAGGAGATGRERREERGRGRSGIRKRRWKQIESQRLLCYQVVVLEVVEVRVGGG